MEQLKAQYEIQCEKDNTNDKKELLEAKRRMMDLDDLIKGLYENFTLGRLPERQFNRLMTEYDTEQSNLEQRISKLETATERISTKAVQIDKFVRLVKKYRDFEELTTPMLNDFIEKVVIRIVKAEPYARCRRKTPLGLRAKRLSRSRVQPLPS